MRHIGHGAAGNVVEHHGQIDRFSNRFEMLELAFLGGLVVIGHHLQLAICANTFGELSQFDGFCCGVGAAASHDRHMAVFVGGGLLDRDADDFAMFFHVDRGGLTRCAHHADAIGAFSNMPIDQLAQRRVVNAPVFVHGSDECDDAAGDGFHRRMRRLRGNQYSTEGGRFQTTRYTYSHNPLDKPVGRGHKTLLESHNSQAVAKL